MQAFPSLFRNRSPEEGRSSRLSFVAVFAHFPRTACPTLPLLERYEGRLLRVLDFPEVRAQPVATANAYACHDPCLRTARAKHTRG